MAEYATSLCGYRQSDEVSETIKQMAVEDRPIYDNLVESLSKYLSDVQKERPKKNSVAAIIFDLLLDSIFDVKIFSFNYTDLRSIASNLGVKKALDITYIHGNLKEGIILGIESNMDFCPPYRYMCKEYSPFYKSCNLSNELHEAKHVIIFGHSLSAIDYHYFQRFFTEQSRENMTYADQKHITIFTHNENSAWNICDQLRKMNNKRLDLLYGQNVLEIIRTDGTDEHKISQFCKYIQDLDGYYK